MSTATKGTQVKVSKEDIIKSLVEAGMSLEQAEEAYQSAFAPQSGSGPKLPFSLIKVNNDPTVAAMGALVSEAIKNEDSGEVEGYQETYLFEDVDTLILDRRAMYSMFDGATGRTTVKSELLDTYAKVDAYRDAISGRSIKDLKEEGLDVKYQQLILIGVRTRGTTEPFKFYCMYLKGAILYSVNQLLDTCTGSQYVIFDATTKTSKKGSVKYTEFDLTKSVATPLESTQVLMNVMPFLEAKTAFNRYVTDYNKSLDGSVEAPKEAGLPA